MYCAYQVNRALALPVNCWAGLVRDIWSHPWFPMSRTTVGRAVASAGEVLERLTRRYPKAPWDLGTTEIDGRLMAVEEKTCLETPFCDLVHFEREGAADAPKVLLVAPLSGNHATLLRDTAARLLPEHDLYVTDWIDARLVPRSKGRFDLDDYIALVQRFLRHVGPGVHVVAVCQSCVPVLAAVSLMEESDDPAAPRSMTFMAGPLDTRVNPTAAGRFARTSPLAWFDVAAVHRVPFGEPGFGRKVHPGFQQLAGFLSIDLPRHVGAHRKLYADLVRGDAASAEVHRRFYDDYLAVMDVPAEYYLQFIQKVFRRHDLARGRMTWRGQRVRPDRIRRAALMTVEGAKDVVTRVGQTAAAHAICSGIPADRRSRLVQPGVGHFGVFRGRRWREEIAPKVSAFIRAVEARSLDRTTSGSQRPLTALAS
jgi:poly(3-hydroxybutyrate) depolymerase